MSQIVLAGAGPSALGIRAIRRVKAVSEGDVGTPPLFLRGYTKLSMNGITTGCHDISARQTQVPALETDQFRIVVPKLCERSVKQYSGYFNIAKDKHMFFWFFESRSSPSTDPLVLWMNGGPGGDSSANGLLFELGPCSIASEGRTTVSNPHSWTNSANIIFLDQPVDVGFSYADPGAAVKNCADAAKDQFPEYAKLPFHVAGESFAGSMGPTSHPLALSPKQGSTRINLASVILANGITDPEIQIPSIVDYVCDGPYPVYDDPNGPECTKLRSSVLTCKLLIKMCNLYTTDFTCGHASRYCRSRLFEPSMKSDLNWYDLRKKCDAADRPEHCYKRTPWVETWMNNPKVKAALGVDPDRSFRSFNMDMNREFNMRGEGVHNAAKLLPELIKTASDCWYMMANYMGNERWVENLDTKFKSQFAAAEGQPWSVPGSNEIAGQARSAGAETAGAGILLSSRYSRPGECYSITASCLHPLTDYAMRRFRHMVAHDQPAAALDLFTRWIKDIPL
ncbi:serine carboxypeptidase [Mycena olivaceomarginata]|nr:serine carboxypeptidase [Mycena olivaceomarginata]